MRLLSLFSGAGLGDLGWLMAGFDIVAQCEIDEYCQKVLALRFPESIKYKDIKELTGEKIKKEVGAVDIVAGGFPCQPFSVAGKQRGKNDERYLWPEMFRIIEELSPSWIVIENVAGIINIAIETICYDLEAEGYEVAPIVFPAHALGAWHKRQRVWIIAFMADAINGRPQNRRAESNGSVIYKEYENLRPTIEEFCRTWWKTEPDVGRVVDGGSGRVDRFKALGNGQVVACTAFIGQRIMEFERLTLPAAGEKG